MSNSILAHSSAERGLQLKETSLAALESRRPEFVLRARRRLLLVLLMSGVATMDDVRSAIELPADIDPKLFGAVPGMLAKLGIIEQDGLSKTTRPQAHARPLTRWRLVDRDAAKTWLKEHPDPGRGGSVPRQVLLFPAHEKGAAGGNR